VFEQLSTTFSTRVMLVQSHVQSNCFGAKCSKQCGYENVNTLRTRLIQAVQKKIADSHVALRGNFSAPVRSSDSAKASKYAASLVD